MATQLGFALGGILLGFFADIIGVKLIIIISAFFGFGAIYFYSKLKD